MWFVELRCIRLCLILYSKSYTITTANFICDRACENQPSSHIKIALFFQLCPFITYNLFETTTQSIYHRCRESFKAYRMLIVHLELEIFIVM